MNKSDDLHMLTDTDDYHFVFITESWLHDYIPNSLVFDCNKFNVDRVSSRGGGVCILINKRYKVVTVSISEKDSDLEILAVDVVFKQLNYRLILCYRPPGYSTNDSNYFNRFLSCLCELCNTGSTLVLVGDFNLPCISWSDTPLAVKNDNFHPAFLDFVSQYGFNQFVSEHTRGKNTLDLVLANDPLVIHDCLTFAPLGNSDHDSIAFNISLPHVKEDFFKCRDAQLYTYDFKNADFEMLNAYVYSVNWSELFTHSNDPNECIEIFMNVLNAGLEQSVPFKRVCDSKRSSKYYPLSVRKLQRSKCRAWRCYKQYKTDALKIKYSASKKKCDEAMESFIRQQEEHLINNGNLGSFYRYVNGKLTFKSGVSTLKDLNGTPLSDDMTKAERLSEHFSSVFTVDNGILPHISKKVDDETELNNVDFTPDLVYKHSRKLKEKTSSGPDHLPTLLLKNLAGSLSEPLSLLFSKLFSMSALPDIWKLAIITPVYKKGSPSDASNYRPISLTCILSKLMESVIKDAMLSYLLEHKLINKQQHGFISKRSTCSQLLECINDWTVSLSHKQSIDIAYIDFSRAFDSVVHSKLYLKLNSLGISGNLLDWIHAFLTNRLQAVRVANSTSSVRPVLSGVPQGTVLGPILFLIYINDIVDIFGRDLTVKLYADDIKMYTAICDIASITELQLGLDQLSNWADEWQLSIALNKCSVLHVGKNNPIHVYSLRAELLQGASEAIDLGVIIDDKLRFTSHYASIAKKAHQRASLILRCFKCRDPVLLTKAYLVYVRPLLEYCSPVWAPVYIKDIALLESVQRRFTKRISGMSDLNYLQRLKTLNLETLEARRLKTDLLTMFKILNNLIAINFQDFFSMSTVVNTRGHRFKLIKPVCKNNTRLFSFSCRRIDCWNSLPDHVIYCDSIYSFKSRLNALDLTKYLFLSF